jgi:hypothetical protein
VLLIGGPQANEIEGLPLITNGRDILLGFYTQVDDSLGINSDASVHKAHGRETMEAHSIYKPVGAAA